MMTAAECNRRAVACSSNAALSDDARVSLEFLGLSAQWRALAVREIYLGIVDAGIAISSSGKILGHG
jgi:hypothetical protein